MVKRSLTSRRIKEAPGAGGRAGASGSVWGEPVMGREKPITISALHPLCPTSNTSGLRPFFRPAVATLDHFHRN